ncbi:CatA-like O-acetyltransferase [Mucilaginibacter psychrotolerans]|uniref:Chloramphenicol acetyltransferase n=1 Tax=Mucilaginibacter psychrotolerans TaxID=1524096 RepID=A0A4Y8SDS6_9SPHI|nr:CatA-like O-acetyltransferase [Mucilaginibacter psychrotolerans]TFF36765.1 chloramphenicol acetyltransferase [Mucilaginibacter psychrotolerans]
MRTKIELAGWLREDHFKLFNSFEEPYFSINVDVDVTAAYAKAKELGVSFYLYYLYCAITAINKNESFRYRAINDEVFLYDRIDVTHVVLRPNGTFGFGFVPYVPTLEEFIALAKADTDRILTTTGLDLSIPHENIIHFSAMPGIKFTGLTHARSFAFKDSSTKLSVGQVTEVHGKKMMPLSITVHHGLTDGLHVGQFIDLYQQLLNA